MIKISQCFLCANYLGKYKCTAYDKIPNDILFNKHDHKKSYKDDNGIRFKPKPKENK